MKSIDCIFRPISICISIVNEHFYQMQVSNSLCYCFLCFCNLLNLKASPHSDYHLLHNPPLILLLSHLFHWSITVFFFLRASQNQIDVLGAPFSIFVKIIQLLSNSSDSKFPKCRNYRSGKYTNYTQ